MGVTEVHAALFLYGRHSKRCPYHIASSVAACHISAATSSPTLLCHVQSVVLGALPCAEGAAWHIQCRHARQQRLSIGGNSVAQRTDSSKPADREGSCGAYCTGLCIADQVLQLMISLFCIFDMTGNAHSLPYIWSLSDVSFGTSCLETGCKTII